MHAQILRSRAFWRERQRRKVASPKLGGIHEGLCVFHVGCWRSRRRRDRVVRYPDIDRLVVAFVLAGLFPFSIRFLRSIQAEGSGLASAHGS